MSVKINNLSKFFRKGPETAPVFENVCFEAAKGEIFCLMGANGAGKTTLLKIISTLVIQTAGSVSVCGFDTIKEAGEARMKLGFAFDSERGFYQMLTAEENLLFYSRMFGMSRQVFNIQCAKLSGALGLGPWLKEPVAHCSSGVKQRLAVARALLTDPEVLLIDELSKSLDRDSADSIRALVKEWVKVLGKTCVIVTHDPAEAAVLGDRAASLRDGRLEWA
jgi:ABC-type multidrug transport system ATPase subunit